MGFDNKVRLPSGDMQPVADNQIPYDLNCPIDGTQLAERNEYDHTGYDCVTCKTHYSVGRGRISQEELERQAKSHMRDNKSKLGELDKEKSRLLTLIDLAEKNSLFY